MSISRRERFRDRCSRACKGNPERSSESEGFGFEGVICLDTLEHVPPEDWPCVLGNFQRALKPGGYLYFSVELADQDDLDAAFRRAQDAGLPGVYGEWPDENVYHHYPAIPQVEVWLQGASFELFKGCPGEDAYDYYHVISYKVPALTPVATPAAGTPPR